MKNYFLTLFPVNRATDKIFFIPFRRIFFAVLIALVGFHFQVAFAGPLIIRNGAGAGEFYVIYARDNYHQVLSRCQANFECAHGIESDLRQMLEQPLQERFEFSFTNAIELGNRLFEIPDHQLKVAGPIKILINKNQLYADHGSGLETWHYEDAIVLMTNLTGDLYGWDRARTNNIVKAVKRFSMSQTLRTRLNDLELRQFSLVLVQAPGSTFLIEDSDGGNSGPTLEIPMASAIVCPLDAAAGNTNPSSETILSPSEIIIRSARWSFVNRLRGPNPVLTASGSVEFTCEKSAGVFTVFRAVYRVSVATGASDAKGHRSLLAETLRINIDSAENLESTSAEAQ